LFDEIGRHVSESGYTGSNIVVKTFLIGLQFFLAGGIGLFFKVPVKVEQAVPVLLIFVEKVGPIDHAKIKIWYFNGAVLSQSFGDRFAPVFCQIVFGRLVRQTVYSHDYLGHRASPDLGWHSSWHNCKK
jgi:hypothetical protein